MHGPHNYHQQGPKNAMDDIRGGFTTTLAAMVALLLASPFNAVTAPYVIALAEKSYPPEIVDLIGIAWMIAAYPFCFFAARASLIALLTAAGVYLAYRLF